MAIACPSCQKQNPDLTLLCKACASPLPQPFHGYRLGDIEIDRPIAKGGFGAIFLGFHCKTRAPYAVKGILPQLADDPKIVARFQREARALAAIHHEGIVEIVDIGVDHAFGMYILMEWLQGETLLAFLSKRAPCPKPDVLYLASQIFDALHAAHQKGMIHRDLKPENIMLVCGPHERTTLKLLDFGLALLTDEEDLERLTTEGSMMGTPSYMAPEQIRGSHDVRLQADLYACGVLLAQLLTGRIPFDTETPNATIYHKFSKPPTSLAESAPQISFSKALEAFHQKALSIDPAGRFSSAQEMWKAFEKALASERIKLAPSMKLIPPQPPPERFSVLTAPRPSSAPAAPLALPAPLVSLAPLAASNEGRSSTGAFSLPPSAKTSFDVASPFAEPLPSNASSPYTAPNDLFASESEDDLDGATDIFEFEGSAKTVVYDPKLSPSSHAFGQPPPFRPKEALESDLQASDHLPTRPKIRRWMLLLPLLLGGVALLLWWAFRSSP